MEEGDGDVRERRCRRRRQLSRSPMYSIHPVLVFVPSVERAFVACEQDPGLARAVLGAVPWPRRPLPLRALYSTVPLSISLALGFMPLIGLRLP